jgi:transketolase
MESTTASEAEILQKAAHTLRALSVDAIEKAQSGHPGLPLGAAEFGTYLFAKVLRFNPGNPAWLGRDRFVLSAGHGSMLLYSLLHLTGYDLSLDDIRNFRVLHSATPGHPEFGEAPGVETTTGPLGQGVACGVGMAIAQKLAANRFGEELFDAKVWVLAGDGCIMEGVASEASSIAGTLGLDNLVVVYDCNQVCLDGPITEAMIEDVGKRYEAYGFQVLSVDGYDWDAIADVCQTAREAGSRPVFIILHTEIGKYAPTKGGTYKAHGGALGAEEATAVKDAIGWGGKELFHAPEDVTAYFASLRPAREDQEADWNRRRDARLAEDPDKTLLWNQVLGKEMPADFENEMWNLEIPPDQATRKASEYAINRVGQMLPWVITGSADLSSCDFTWLLHSGIVAKDDWGHQQIKFGAREFGMGACAYGIALHGLFTPAVGTFLTFSDYMKNAIRLTALMKQRVVFVYSHDSVFLAEDGPTHQPIEHLMSLRMMPGLIVIRPGDENEVKAAWAAAMKVTYGPVALCFTRQDVASTVSDLTVRGARAGVPRGGYVLFERAGDGSGSVLIIATGSEIHPAVGAARVLADQGIAVRVVSLPSWELFEQQGDTYRKSVLGEGYDLRVSVEAGVSLGWQKFVGENGLSISMETYGASAPSGVLADHFGFTAAKITQNILERLEQSR